MKRKDEPEIDVSLLTEEQRKEYEKKPNYLPWFIAFGVFLAIIVALVIVILNLPK
ncbi:MAG: hypothetical protein K6B65_02450 [Bacilli bacterium]|nr:hypothetical protein [Bacilli bacterium]